MSKIWFCANCGYEVDAKGRCHLCHQKLTASPLAPLPAADEDQEVGYRIADWTDRARGQLILSLVEQRIVHRFEDDDLVVGVDDEGRVDDLVEELAESGDAEGPFITGAGADPERFVGEVEGETILAVGMMFRAAKRLRVDPTDMEADGDVAEASAGIFMTEQFPGTTVDEWAAVGRVTRRLLAALGAEEALEEEIRQQAAVLATLLQPAVAATETAGSDGSPVGHPAAVIAGTGDGGGEDSDGGAPVVTTTGTAAELPIEDVIALADDREARSAAAALGIDAVLGLAPDPVPAGEADGAGDQGDVGGLADDDGPADDGGLDDGDAPLLLGGGPETSYEVPEWLPEQRALLAVLLEDRAIPFAWDDGDLVVPSVDEQAVEGLFDQVGGVGEDDDDETRYRAIEELFAAVGRLAGDPDDKERIADVIAASSAVEGPTPLGYDDGRWLALRRRARTLADALEHNADPDVVESQAASLRDALRELV